MKSMQNETKNCQNCKNDFTIESEDFAFYEKIKVPPPTFCPQCRLIRRLAWRNERTLYKRKCDLCKKDTISIYSLENSCPVYCLPCYDGDNWNPLDFGLDYDLDQNFFVTLGKVFNTVPHPAVDVRSSTDCDYTNHCSNSKNCYLSFGVSTAENTFYSTQAHFSKDIFDGDFVFKGDSLYDNVNCHESFQVFYSVYTNSCLDSYFLYDCMGCSNCFGCANLRNKEYHIFNKPYSKEEYQKFIEEINLGSRSTVDKIKKEFQEFLLKQPVRFAHIRHSVDSTGDNLEGSKNAKFCFGTRDGVEDCKYCAIAGLSLKDSYDIYAGGIKSELAYECVSFMGNSNVHFSKQVRESVGVQYSELCLNCHDLFGCFGLKNKKYCIFNKQYTKEEYEEIVPKLIEFSKNNPCEVGGKKYSFGEFFPTEDSTFSYNETIAQEFFPLNKEEALKRRYKWLEEKDRNYVVTQKASDLPDDINDVTESILKEVIACEHEGECIHKCTTAFRITSTELEFYKKHKIPLPTACPNCRYFERLSKRSELSLYDRQCMCDKKHPDHQGQCEVVFKTAYGPNRPEILYCEKCYQQEVY